MSYEVFFSYNSQDRAAVEEIARKLLERGIRCFLDLWYLPKGLPWRSLLEQTDSLCVPSIPLRTFMRWRDCIYIRS